MACSSTEERTTTTDNNNTANVDTINTLSNKDMFIEKTITNSIDLVAADNMKQELIDHTEINTNIMQINEHISIDASQNMNITLSSTTTLKNDFLTTQVNLVSKLATMCEKVIHEDSDNCQLQDIEYGALYDEVNLFPELGDAATYDSSKVKMYSQHDIDNFEQLFGPDMEYERKEEMHENSRSKQSEEQKKLDHDEQCREKVSEPNESCMHNVAEYGAASLPTDHRHLIDTLLGRPSVEGRNTSATPSQPISLEIDRSDLEYLYKLLVESQSKTNETDLESISVRKRDTDWISLFEKYLSKVNDSCVCMYKGHHFSTAKSSKRTTYKQFMMSADAKCKFSAYTCSFHANVLRNGELIITFKGRIIHSPSEQRARPIRGNHRRSIAETLTNGVNPDQLRLKELGNLTDNNRKFGNYNLVGSSLHVFRKIRSEAKTSLMLDKDLTTSLQKINEEQIKEINAGKVIPGYLQTITISPLRLTLFTEGAFVLWNQVGNRVPVSWDTTEGIVMNKGKRVFYYELTITNIAARSITTKNLSGPSFPVTLMLSASHTTMDLVQWLQDFEGAYRKLYGFKHPFPKPPIVHSDGALVFQMAAMRFFNGDTTISSYLKRCWTIVNRNATNEELSKTIVHSCLSHFSKSVKRQALQFFSKRKVFVSQYSRQGEDLSLNDEERLTRPQVPNQSTQMYTNPESTSQRPQRIIYHHRYQYPEYQSPYAYRPQKQAHERKTNIETLPVISNQNTDRRLKQSSYEAHSRYDPSQFNTKSKAKSLERNPINNNARLGLWDVGYHAQTDDEDDDAHRNKKKRSIKPTQPRAPWVPVW